MRRRTTVRSRPAANSLTLISSTATRRGEADLEAALLLSNKEYQIEHVDEAVFNSDLRAS